MSKTGITAEFIDQMTKLANLAEDKDKKKKLGICTKILKLLQTRLDEETDFDLLIDISKSLSDKLNAEILKLILEVQVQCIPEYKLDDYRQKLLSLAFVLQPDEKPLKISAVAYGTDQCKIINTDKRTANDIATFMLFDCLLCDPSHENITLMSNLVNSDIDFPRLLLDLIIVTTIQITICLIHKKAFDLKYREPIYQIFFYYFTKAKSKTFFNKKLIIGLLCLDYQNNKTESYNIIKLIMRHNSLDTMDLLLDILRIYFTDRNCLEGLSSFEQYQNYLSFIYLEDNHDRKVKISEQYDMFYTDFQKKLFPKNDNKKEIIKESAFSIIMRPEIKNKTIENVFVILKYLYELQLEDKTFQLNFPLVNLFDFLGVLLLEIIDFEYNIVKAIVELIMTLTIKYQDEIIVIIYDIVNTIGLKFVECNEKMLFQKDQKMKQLGKKFIDLIVSFVVSGKIRLNNYSQDDCITSNVEINDNISIMMIFIKNNEIECESTLVLKAMFYFENFKQNNEAIFKDLLIKINYPTFNYYIIELLRSNYYYSKNKVEVIEDNIIKYLSSCVISFAKNSLILNSFIHLLIDIMLKTQRETFFCAALNEIIAITEPPKLLQFQVNSLTLLYQKLNKNYDYSKLMLANHLVIKNENFTKKSALKFMLPFLKNITVNKDYEVFFSTLKEEDTMPSQIILNPNKEEIGIKPLNLDYKHYVLWNHITIFDHLMQQTELNGKDDLILENIFEIFSFYTKQIFPLKYINFNSLIKVLSNKSYIIQRTNGKIDQFALSTYVFLCYHCNSSFVSYQNITNCSILNITDVTYKTQLIELLGGAYFHLIDKVINEINKEPKHLLNPKKFTLNASSGEIKHNNNVGSSSSLNNLANASTSDEDLINKNIKIKIHSINKILATLHYYLNSITEYNQNNLHLPFSNDYLPQDSSIKIDNSQISLFINQLLKKITDSLWVFQIKLRYGICIVNFLLGIKELLFKLGEKVIIKVIIIAFAIGWRKENLARKLEERLKIKEIDCIKRDNEIDLQSLPPKRQLKFFFLQHLADTLALYFMERVTSTSKILNAINNMMISLPGSFRKHLFFELSKWHLSSRTFRDNLKSFYRNVITEDSQILLGKKSIIIIAPNSQTKTDLIIRSTIMNINISINANFSKVQYLDAFKFLKTDRRTRSTTTKEQSNSLLSLLPNSVNKSSSFRNSLEPDKEFYDSATSINNSFIIFQQLLNLTSEPLDTYELCKNKKLLKDNLPLLDSESVYTVFHCGVLFIPINCLDNENDLFAYNEEVSEEYTAFLHTLGHLYNIRENRQIKIGEMGSKKKNTSNGSYVICHQDSLFQLVFQVSHFITTNNEREEPLDMTRKRIISKNFVNLIWMDNPYKTFDENLINVNRLMIFFIISPISSTHYIVRKTYNRIADDCLSAKIKKELFEEFMININDTSSIMYLIHSIIQMNMMQEYFIEMKKINNEERINETVFGVKNYYERYNMITNLINNNKDN